MKFGKNLQSLIQEAPPEWRDKYLSYKDLKKSLKMIISREGRFDSEKTERRKGFKRRKIDLETATDRPGKKDNGSDAGFVCPFHECTSNGSNQAVDEDCTERFTSLERGFIRMLQPQLDKLNDFFVEKEAEYIIRQKELLDGIQKIRNRAGPDGKFPSKRDVLKLLKDMVDFHGEAVLLVWYSIVNFTGLVKIVKKYDKRMGGILRVEYMQRVLEEPFFELETVFKIVKQCESLLQDFFAGEGLLGENDSDDALYFRKDGLLRRIEAARRSMLEMRRESSTKSPFSLPPLEDFS